MGTHHRKKKIDSKKKRIKIGFKHEDCINGQAVGSISFNELKGEKWVTEQQARDLANILNAEFIEY